jgi:hypothetical protein
MTAIVLPDLDRSTIEDLKARMPTLHLSEIELPSIERAGRQADRAIDRLLGRSRPSAWPWVAAVVGIVAIIGTAAALMTWNRRPSWTSWQSRGQRSLGDVDLGSGIPGSRSGIGGTDTGIGTTPSYGETALSGSTTEVTSLEEPMP